MNDCPLGWFLVQRRRFQAAVETDAQPTLEGEVVLLPTRAVTASDQAVAAERGAVVIGSTGAMRSEDVLKLTPARWLSLIRCETYTEQFEALGNPLPSPQPLTPTLTRTLTLTQATPCRRHSRRRRRRWRWAGGRVAT